MNASVAFKVLTILTALFVTTETRAQSSIPVFDCNASVQIDATTSEPIGISVVAQGSDYFAYLIGATQTGPLKTLKQVLPLQDALTVAGVRDILSTTSLTSIDIAKVTSVIIYTEGNFDDDAAGVRKAEFVDAQNVVLANGMFFGWAGPFACK